MARTNLRDKFASRVYPAAALLGGVVVIGASGYHLLGGGRWSWSDCLYMTVITLSTVGYGETLEGFQDVPYARLWTISQIVLGSGTLVYFVSTFTAFFVEGDIQGAIRRNRMQKKIDGLRDHVIVVGVGATGTHVVEELVATKTPFVVIEEDSERLDRINQEIAPDLLYVQGEATDDHILEQAGIRYAKGLVVTLGEDKDNVFVTITARALNPTLRIIAKVTENSAKAKLKRAGADVAISPSMIGGMRMVSELIRPKVVQFLDQMLYNRDYHLRIEEVQIPEHSSLVGASLQNTTIRLHTRVLVLAVRHADGKFSYNPGPDFVLEANTTLVILAETDDVIKLREGIADGSIGRV